MAIDNIVAVKTPPKSKPPSAKIIGFKNMMYAIVKKVVTPAMTSVLKSVLCFLYSKYLSNIEPPNGGKLIDSKNKIFN